MTGVDKTINEFLGEIKVISGARLSTQLFVHKVTDLQERIIAEIKMRKELRTAWRLKKDEFKWFKEELAPMRTFLQDRQNENEFITAINGNQNFDAKLESNIGDIYIEVTSTSDHIDKRLMEHLEKYGRAPLTIEDHDSIICDRKLSKEYSADATDVEEAIEKDWGLITRRISKKMTNQEYKGRYILLVEYSPSILCRFEEVVDKIVPITSSPIFEKVFLVEPWKMLTLQIPTNY